MRQVVEVDGEGEVEVEAEEDSCRRWTPSRPQISTVLLWER